jgi:8-oxo-dGTP pyrophosphatase MutT (NUDIX family)
MSDDFHDRLSRILTARTPRRVSLDDARDAAVLVPVVGSPAPALIFTVRTESLPSHKGQISFPGGSIDPDESPVEAALREANEEIGIEPDAVEVLGELDSMPTFVSGYVIAPVVGWLTEMPELVPNPAEVAEVFAVPIAELVDDIHAQPGFTHHGQTYPTEAWLWDDHVIWGVTARLLRTFLDMLARAGLAQPPGPEPEWPSEVGLGP